MRADDVAGRMRIRAARDHVLHANSTLPDRVDLAIAAIAVLSTGLSALAPAQRAGAQRLRALARLRHSDCSRKCPLFEEEQKRSAEGQSDAIDPQETGTFARNGICEASGAAGSRVFTSAR